MSTEQLPLLPNPCQLRDSRNIMCNANMSDEEAYQDGMCSNCADALWNYEGSPAIRGGQAQEWSNEEWRAK